MISLFKNATEKCEVAFVFPCSILVTLEEGVPREKAQAVGKRTLGKQTQFVATTGRFIYIFSEAFSL